MPIPAARAPFTQPYADLLDANGNGCLSDGERDEDNDMLSNNVELSGAMSDISWWTQVVDTENPFTYRVLAGTKWLDGDTDGDGVYDGMDDSDFDDYWNAEEIVRGSASVDGDGNATGATGGLWVQPFNPCLPNRFSRTCPDFVPVGGAPWAPWPDDQGRLPEPRWPLAGTGAPTHPIPIPS
jgi:hypothetical protein